MNLYILILKLIFGNYKYDIVILIEKQILIIWLKKQKKLKNQNMVQEKKSKYFPDLLNLTWEKSGILVNLGWISRRFLEETFIVF